MWRHNRVRHAASVLNLQSPSRSASAVPRNAAAKCSCFDSAVPGGPYRGKNYYGAVHSKLSHNQYQIFLFSFSFFFFLFLKIAEPLLLLTPSPADVPPVIKVKIIKVKIRKITFYIHKRGFVLWKSSKLF